MNNQTHRAFTLVEVIIAVSLIMFAAVAVIEIFGNGVKNIERLSDRYESRYLHTFLINDDAVIAGSSSGDFYKYLSSKYSIENSRVYEYLNGVNYAKSEEERPIYLKDSLNNELLRVFSTEVDINKTVIDVIQLKELIK